jgi:hypothetical protein
MASVDAVWTGPFDAEIPGIGSVAIGQECEIDEAELSSGHWQPVQAPALPAATAPPAAASPVASSTSASPTTTADGASA